MSEVAMSIGGRTYRMACDDGQENHLMQLARDLDVILLAARTGAQRLKVEPHRPIGRPHHRDRAALDLQRAAKLCARAAELPEQRLKACRGVGAAGAQISAGLRELAQPVVGGAAEVDPVPYLPGAHLHLYSKEPRGGRKLGHVTLRSDDEAALRRFGYSE